MAAICDTAQICLKHFGNHFCLLSRPLLGVISALTINHCVTWAFLSTLWRKAMKPLHSQGKQRLALGGGQSKASGKVRGALLGAKNQSAKFW